MTRFTKLVVMLFMTLMTGVGCMPSPVAPEPTVTPFLLPTAAPATIEAPPTLSEALADIPELSSLADALRQAELETALESTEAITLFAPNNAAFAALPTTVATDLYAEDNELLSELLQYHVITRSIPAAEVGFNTSLVTLLGETVTVEEDTGGQIRVGGAQLVTTDIAIDNGTIHIIDSVLEPSIVSFDTSIADITAQRDNLSTLSSALDLANLTDTLDADIEYTILTPSNTAFDALPDTLLEELDNNPVRLAEVLSYHVVLGRLTRDDLAEQRFIQTVQGQTLYISTVEGGLTINGAAILLEADIEASNGLVHIIDSVLLPSIYETEATVSIAEIIGQRAEFSTMLAAVLAAGYGNELQAPGQYTLLSPTNQAFANLPEGTLDDLLADPGQLREVILYHTLPGIFTEGDINAATSLPSLTGQPILIEDVPFSSEVLLNGEADLQLTNLRGNNGIVHQIDRVLFPPEEPQLVSIAAIIAENPALTTLNEAAQTANVQQTWVDADEITVFAPTNAAFEALPDGISEQLLSDRAQLQRVLLYHMLNQARSEADLIDRRLIQTLAGSPVLIFEDRGMFTVNGAQFITTDIEASNGTVHIIDSVILPSPEATTNENNDSAAEIIAVTDELSTFTAAVEQGGYSNLLTGQGPFTIFAPSNEAFETIDEATFNTLFSDPPATLRPFLLNHIVLGRFSEEQLANFNQLLLASGVPFPINQDSGALDTSMVSTSDIEARNATIHIIDTILSLDDN